MVLRLISGIATRRRARRGRGPARRRGRAGCCSGRGTGATTCSASPARIRPWSTKTQVSWSPIASWISTAATAESTPPDRPQMTRPAPDLRADALDRLVAEGRHGPVAAAADDVAHEVADQQRAVRRVDDLRVELHAVEAPRLVGDDREGRVRRHRQRSKPSGSLVTRSPWLIQTGMALADLPDAL